MFKCKYKNNENYNSNLVLPPPQKRMPYQTAEVRFTVYRKNINMETNDSTQNDCNRTNLTELKRNQTTNAASNFQQYRKIK